VSDAATVREIAITRIYDAPREAVWRAWTEPERLAAWWGKRGWSTPVDSITLDARPGGAFRLTSVSEADGAEMPLDAVFREVVAPERLAFVRRGRPETSVVTFTDLGDGRTEMRFRTTLTTTAAIHRAAAGGLESAFDRLAQHLTPSTARSST
jgi:uncharacterized protein YndB with AHSA1/START domain